MPSKNPFNPVEAYAKSAKPEDMSLGSYLDFLEKSRVEPAPPGANPESITDRAMSGLESTRRSAVLAGMAAADSTPEDLANVIVDGQKKALPKTKDAQEIDDNSAAAIKSYDESSGVNAVPAFANLAVRRLYEHATHPKETLRKVAENVSNSLPGLVAGVGGAAAGTAVAGPLGGLAGGIAAGTAGGVIPEFGSEFEQRVINKVRELGLDPTDPAAVAQVVRDNLPEFREKALAKGVTTSAVDAVLTRLTFGLGSMGERALAKEAQSIGKQAAAGTITKADAATALAAIEAKQTARSTLGQQAKRGALETGGEMFGEGASEGVGRVATGDPFNAVEAIDEGVLAVGQGGVMAAGGKVTNKALGLTPYDSVDKSLEAAKVFAAHAPETIAGKIQAQVDQGNSPLSRAAQAANPALAPDDISLRAKEVEDAFRANNLLQKLGEMGQGALTRQEFLEALAIAKNKNMPPEHRKMALDSLNQAMQWISDGKMPNEPGTGSPFSTELTTQPAPVAPGTDLATVPGGELTTPGMPQAFDPNVVDVDATRVDNMVGGPRALPAPAPQISNQPENPAGPAGFTSPGETDAATDRVHPAATEGVPQGRDNAEAGMGSADGAGHGRNAEQAWAPAGAMGQPGEYPSQVPSQTVEGTTSEPTPPQAVQAEKEGPQTPAARKSVEAPQVFTPTGDGPDAKLPALVRRRKAQLAAMAADGFETVESRGNGFYLVNTKANTELKLDGMADAQRARKAIADFVQKQSDTAAASPNNDRLNPTDGQIAAGNYKKSDVIPMNGMRVVLENPRGSTRSGVSKDGKRWSNTMKHHYGEILGTEASDGDRLDTFIGTRPDSNRVFVIDQINDDGTYDESKVMQGFMTEEDARKGYLDNYDKGWKGLGAITEMTPAQFQAWAKSDLAKEPAVEYARQQKTRAENDERRTGAAQAATKGDADIASQIGNTRGSEGSRQDGWDVLRNDATGRAEQEGKALRDPAADAAAALALSQIEGRDIALADPASQLTQVTNTLLDLMASLTGHRGIAVDDRSNKAFDGAYHGATGRYFVNVNAPQVHIAQTLAHEFKHLTERYPALKQLYDRMWSLIPMPVRKEYFEQYLFKRGPGIEHASEDQLAKLKDEMLADFLGQRFSDKEWLQQLAEQKPNLFGNFVREWLGVLKGLIQELKGIIANRRTKGLKAKDIDAQLAGYVKQLEELKAIATEVATAWAERNPKLADRTGAGMALLSSRDIGARQGIAEPKAAQVTSEVKATGANFIGAKHVQMSWGAKPAMNTGLLHKMGSEFDSEEQKTYLIAMRNALSMSAPSAQTLLGWGKRYSESITGGSGKGLAGWSVQSTLSLPDGIVDARTRNEVAFFLSVNGLLFGQDAMAWHAPRFGENGRGIEFNLGGKKLRDTQFEEVYASIQKEFGRYDISPIQSKDGLRFLNFTDLSHEEFQDKLIEAIGNTSVAKIWKEARSEYDTGRASRNKAPNESIGGPLRPGSSNLSGGREHDANAFTEGIRTFDSDGDLIANDWSKGEGQYRERIVEAWTQLKDLPGHRLPTTIDSLNKYLRIQQTSVDRANRYFVNNYKLGKAELTLQERESGVTSRSEFPSFAKAQTDRAQGAYFRHPDGTLMTLYHGTPKELGKIEERDGIALFATTHPHYANEAARISSEFGEDDTDSQNVAPIHVLASNPFDWRIMGDRERVTPFMTKYPKGFTAKSYDAALRAGKFELLESKEFVDAAKRAGFDAVLVRDDKNFTGVVNVGVFDPSNVVSAFNPYVQFSKRDFVGRTNRTYTPEQLRAFANVGFEVEIPSLKDRAKALWKDAGKKLAQGIVDQFAPVKEISKEAYGLLRLAKGASGAFETLLQGGRLKLTNDVYDFDGGKKGGVLDRLLKPLQGEHHDFLRWVAANRAERLMGEDREHLFTQEDIDAIKTLADGDTKFDYTLQHGPRAGQTTRNRAEVWADSLVTFNAFHENVMDMAEQSGLVDKDARKLWDHEFYVPFYRVSDENGVAGMNIKGGAVRQQAFKKLKGGTDALNNDLLDNTLMNWAHLLDASAKNRAAKATLEAAESVNIAISTTEETARQMGKATGNRNGVVWFMDEGKQHYYLVEDPYVLQAITSLEFSGMKGPMMNAMSAMKNMLTVGVTASPFFKIRNLIRDSIQVIGTGNISFNPAKNLTDGWKLTNPKNDAYFRLLAGGGTIHFGTMYEGSEAKRVQALVESGVDRSTILDDEHKVQAFYRKFIEPGVTAYNELGNRGEAINRAALYDQLIKQGVSHADASLQARDLMDFSMQGSFATVRFLTQIVPFLNARLQGLYKLGKAAKEDPKRMAYVTGAVALASLGLLAAYGDDDDWRKREDWDRDNYWWFKFGGQAFRIPKPFELGAIGTLAERSAELVFDDEMTGKHFRSRILSLLGDNLAMNPVPQLVKPMLDVYANLDSFTGVPIESMSDERLQSEYRFTGSTSMTARAASTAMNAATGIVGKEALSPVQIDALIRGYFGWIGMFAVGIADIPARYAADQPASARIDLWKVASGGILSQLDGAPSRYVSNVYEQARAIEQAYGTWRALLRDGKSEEASEFKVANEGAIRGYRSVEAVKGAMAKINQQIRLVERSDRTRDEKRTEIIRLNARREQFAKRLQLQRYE